MVNKINTNIKYATQASAIDSEQAAAAEQLKCDLEQALKELESTTDYFEYLTSEEQAKIMAMKKMIEGEIALIDSYLKTGKWQAVGSGIGASDLSGLDSGWHGNGIQYLDQHTEEFERYAGMVAMDDDAGELVEVISVPNTRTNDVDSILNSAVGFVVQDKDNISKISGKTVGEDIWITVEYENGDVKTWILKGLATRPDVTIYISAQDCTKSIVMDFSKVIRVSKKDESFGINGNGLILVGGKGDDVIVGSQSDDTIVGWEGNDKLYGLGGKDKIFGDGVFKTNMNEPLQSINDDNGGDDLIDGGSQFDQIWGGGGANDTVVKDTGQPVVGADKIYEEEETISASDRVNGDDINEANAILALSGWKSEVNSETGEIVIKRDSTSTGDEIGITAPQGYSMATAEQDGSDIIITFVKVGQDENGDPSPEYIKIRIKGALVSGNNSTIEITPDDSNGSIIDFSKLNSGGNTVILNGTAGRDILIGPVTNLDELHVTAEDLNNGTTLSKAEMEKILNKYKSEGSNTSIWGGNIWSSTLVVGGEIVMTPANATTVDKINFESPAGFGPVDGVFYEVDGNDVIVYIVSVTDAERGQFDLCVVRIKNVAQNGKVPTISVGGEPAQPIGSAIFDSGDGKDLIIGNIGSTTSWGDTEDDTVIKGWRSVAKEDIDEELPDVTKDTDGDGVPDYVETAEGTDPEDVDDYPEWFTPDRDDDDNSAGST